MRLNKSFPKTLTIKLTGVKIKKYIRAITTGAINFPKNSPSCIQRLFNGVNILEFKTPKIKKRIEKEEEVSDEIAHEGKLEGSPERTKKYKRFTPGQVNEIADKYFTEGDST